MTDTLREISRDLERIRTGECRPYTEYVRNGDRFTVKQCSGWFTIVTPVRDASLDRSRMRPITR